MIIRNLDVNSDWTFGSGIQNYKKDLAAIELNIKTRLKSWKGDCFYLPAEGVDYNNFLDVGTKNFLDSDLKRVILQSEGVIKITEYESSLDRDTRALTVSTTIQTIFGIVTLVEPEKEARPEFDTVNKIVPEGDQKLTPDGILKLVFVEKI